MTEVFRVRTVTVADAMTILKLVNHYANQAQMLPKSQNQIFQGIRDFRVVVDESDRIVGCGALHVTWGDLAEVRSLAIAEGYKGKGLGSMLVDRLLGDGSNLELEKTPSPSARHRTLSAPRPTKEPRKPSAPGALWSLSGKADRPF